MMKEDKNISQISHFLTFEFFDMSLPNCWKQTNKQTIDSSAVLKVFNRKRWTGQSFSEIKTPANIVEREDLYVCVRHVTFLISVICGWVWSSFGWVWPFLSGCGWIWVSVTFIFWLGVSGCRWVSPFFGWVWVGVTFFGWVWVGMGECNLFWLSVGGCRCVWPFLTGCRWVWVSAGECEWVHGL